MVILGIETSCDETAASVVSAKNSGVFVLSNVVASQIKLHSKWGGVVPNLAAREHLKAILPIIETAMKEAGAKTEDIDLIAVTAGPGLIPALLIGTSAAKTLAYIWRKPLLDIHHIEGHIYANFINKISVNSKSQIPNPKQFQNSNFKIQNLGIKFPLLCLVVSGGHTQLVLMKNHLKYEIVGQTLDDAAGEAFDKVSRILGLGYPGGPAIARRAMGFKVPMPTGRQESSKFKIALPRPMINSKNLNFSFSGLKTAVLYKTKEFKRLPVAYYKLLVTELAAEFQQSVIDVLISKTLDAASIYKPQTIMLAGGVSANAELRKQMEISVKKNFPKINCIMPDIRFSIDNAAMIAAAGYFRWQKMSLQKREVAANNWKKIKTDANLTLQ